MARSVLMVCLWLLLGFAPAAAQTTLNPDVSLVGDIRAFANDDPATPEARDRINLDLSGLELVIGGYLNPYARADAVFGWEGEETAAIEEAYVTFLRGLPLDANVRVGKYLLEFGHLNPNHPHVFPFVHRPLPHEEFLGEEGLNDLALRAAFLLPTGNTYSEVQFAVLEGGLLPGAPPDPADTTPVASAPVELGYFGRLGLSVATSDYGELAWGVSGVIAQYDPAQTLAASVVGADVKYKWAPGRNTSLQIESELLWNRHETAAAKDLESWGGYAYLDYRFRQRFNVGAIAEMAEGAFEPEVTTRRVGLFLGFAPVEETSVLRLAGDWTEVGDLDGYWSLTLQLVFGLGPHQAHTF